MSGVEWLAAAAFIALVAGALVWFNLPRRPAQTMIAAGDLYEKLVARGFKPEFVCTSDAEFTRAVDTRFGQGLLLASSPDVQLVGWAYSDNYKGITLSRQALILMAKVRGEPVIVLMDQSRHDRPQIAKPESGLHVHRAEVGSLVLYEVSTFDAPQLIGGAYDPAKPGAPKPE
jgi:hypothetical protein